MSPGRRDALILASAGLAAAAAGVIVGPLVLQSGSGTADLLEFGFTDLEGRGHRLTEWSGKIVVCNFWATWCAPCREEIPLLVSTRLKHASKGIEVVGIAVDSAANVREFLKSFPIEYPILLGGAEVLDLMRRAGNSSGGLPYTVILDRRGGFVDRKLGALTERELDSKLQAVP